MNHSQPYHPSVFQRQTISPGILSFPELANRFCRLTSHSRSASSAMSSTALKNFSAFVFGLPNGRNLPAVASKATSSVVQFRSLATSATSNLAGKSFAAHVVIAACVSSSVIRQSHLGIRILQAIPSSPPSSGAPRRGGPLQTTSLIYVSPKYLDRWGGVGVNGFAPANAWLRCALAGQRFGVAMAAMIGRLLA